MAQVFPLILATLFGLAGIIIVVVLIVSLFRRHDKNMYAEIISRDKETREKFKKMQEST